MKKFSAPPPGKRGLNRIESKLQQKLAERKKGGSREKLGVREKEREREREGADDDV